MLTAVMVYRSVCSGKPRAPWRDDREQARRDAIELGLGCYDEEGQFYDIVPGAIETAWTIDDVEAA